MGEVVYIKEWKLEKLNRIIKLAQEGIKNLDLPPLKNLIKGYAISPNLIFRLLVDAHPITRKQKAAGRVLWGNVGIEYVFSSMEHAKNSGFTDVVYEKEAIYGTMGGVKVFENCYAIYGIRPCRNNS